MIACIVLNYNDAITTTNFVERVIKYDCIERVIIVDNHSTDNSFERLSLLSNNKLIVLRNEYNGGYAAGNNRGIKYAIDNFDVDMFVVCNPDVVFCEETVKKIYHFISQGQKVGAVTCKMNCISLTDLPIAWKLPSYKDCILENLIVLRRILGDKTRYKASQLLNREYIEVDVIPGSFFCISKKALLDVDLFDQNTFLYYEENIMSARLKAKGYSNYILLGDEYIHYHSVTIDKSIPSIKKRLIISEDSRLYYCKRYLKINRIQIIIFKITAFLGIRNYLFIRRILCRRNS